MSDLSDIQFNHRKGVDWETEPYNNLIEELCDLEWHEKDLSALSDDDFAFLTKACYEKWSDRPDYIRSLKKFFKGHLVQIQEDCMLYRNNDGPIIPPKLRQFKIFTQKVVKVLIDEKFDTERNKWICNKFYVMHPNTRRAIVGAIINDDETMSIENDHDKIFRKFNRLLKMHRPQVEKILAALTNAEKPETRKIGNTEEERRTPRIKELKKQKDKEKEMELKIINACEKGFAKIHVSKRIGYGIIATEDFKRNEYLIEYAGTLMSGKEEKAMHKKYSEDPKIGCFIFHFKLGSKSYCIDTIKDNGRLARWINHSRKNPNAKVEARHICGRPRLLLFAKRDIEIGEEIRFDYGDRSPQSLIDNSWLNE